MRYATISSLIAALFLAATSLPAQAASAEKIAAAEEVFNILGLTSSIQEEARTIVVNELEHAMMNLPGNYAQYRSAFVRDQAAIIRSSEDAANAGIVKELAHQFATDHADYFTVDELQQIVAYSKTPAGQKMISAQSLVFNRRDPDPSDLRDGVDDAISAVTDEWLRKQQGGR